MRDACNDRPLRDVWRLLDYLARRLRWRAAKTAALWTAAAVLASLAATVAAGAALSLPPSTVWLAAGAGAAVVAAAAGLGYRPRPSATYLARLVERRRPELKASLVTLVELAADPASDRSMQTALARRAARILWRDPPHAFLPDISWRRPAWALAASAGMLGCVLWMAKGTAVAPWLPGATAEMPRVASADTGEEGSGALAQMGADASGGAPRDRGGEHDGARAGGQSPDARGARDDSSQAVAHAGAARDTAGDARQAQGTAARAGHDAGSGAVARAGEADVRRGACAAREGAGDVAQGPEGSSDVAQAAAEARRGAGAARDTAGDPSHAGGGAGSTRHTPRERGGEHGPPLTGGGVDPRTAPEAVADTMRQRKPETDADHRGPNGNEPPRTFLGKMGANPADEKRYTTTWSAGRPRPGARPDGAPPLGHAQTAKGPGDGRLLEAGAGAGARPVVVPADADAGERGKLIHAAEVRVSPRLRPAVRAYFERIGRLGAGK